MQLSAPRVAGAVGILVLLGAGLGEVLSSRGRPADVDPSPLVYLTREDVGPEDPRAWTESFWFREARAGSDLWWAAYGRCSGVYRLTNPCRAVLRSAELLEEDFR